MYLKVFRKDGTTKEYERTDGEYHELFGLVREDTDDSKINYVVFKSKYIHDHSDNYEDFKSLVEGINSLGSVKVSIENEDSFIFELVLKGKLMDIITYFNYLDPNHGFNIVDHFVEEDVALIDSLIRGVSTHFDINCSLILRFLSDKNGNLGYNQIYDILRKEINKSKLKDFLPSIFEEIYKCKPESIKTKPLETDKMSLKAINDKTLKDIEKQISIRLFGREEAITEDDVLVQ